MVRRGKRTHDGYSVENVAFESTPGFLVTATLYEPMPSKTGERHAAVLLAHGHSSDPAAGGRFHESKQKLGALLARAGATALAYDMVGYGESTGHHTTARRCGCKL